MLVCKKKTNRLLMHVLGPDCPALVSGQRFHIKVKSPWPVYSWDSSHAKATGLCPHRPGRSKSMAGHHKKTRSLLTGLTNYLLFSIHTLALSSNNFKGTQPDSNTRLWNALISNLLPRSFSALERSSRIFN